MPPCTEAPTATGTSLGRHRDFRRYLTGQAASVAGSSITQMALPVLAVLQLDATTAQVAWLAFLGQLPPALLALRAGALADRHSERRQVITGDLVGAAVLTSAGLGRAGHPDPGAARDRRGGARGGERAPRRGGHQPAAQPRRPGLDPAEQQPGRRPVRGRRDRRKPPRRRADRAARPRRGPARRRRLLPGQRRVHRPHPDRRTRPRTPGDPPVPGRSRSGRRSSYSSPAPVPRAPPSGPSARSSPRSGCKRGCRRRAPG